MNTVFRFFVLATTFALARPFTFGIVFRTLSTALASTSDNNMPKEVKVRDKIPSVTLQEGLPNFEGKND